MALCSPLQDLPRRLDEWWMEPKLDGIRVQALVQNGQVGFRTRNGTEYNGRLPLIETALATLDQDTVLDGEVVWFDPATGQPDFHRGSGLFRVNARDSVRRQSAEGPLTYVVFDLPKLLGDDLRRFPIEQRRKLLATLVDWFNLPQLRLIEQGEATSERLEEYVGRYREGVVLKRRSSLYPNGRGEAWRKIKVTADEDVVFMGAEPGQGKYVGTLGAVIFGQYRDGVLVERGTCSGMDDATRDDLWSNRDAYVGRVLTIKHFGHDGTPERPGFRHPQWAGFRYDKDAEDCTWS